MSYLKSLCSYFLIKEKALFKSTTIWLSAIVASAPDILNYAQQNWPAIAQDIPHALQAPVMHWIGVAIFLCRMRSMVKLPAAQP